MIPQTGDIWKYRNPRVDYSDEIVLLHELLRDGIGHFSGKPELIFLGYDMQNNSYDEFLFNENNMPFWERLA